MLAYTDPQAIPSEEGQSVLNPSKIAVVVCSVGRPDCLRALVPFLNKQCRAADQVVFVVTRHEDIGFDPTPLFSRGTKVTTLISKKGLPRQRNCGIKAVVNEADIIVFFDDDFLPSRHALAGIEIAFSELKEVGGMTGHLIADGINSEGLDVDFASRLIAKWDASLPFAAKEGRQLRIIRRGLAGLYGCNMAYRTSAIGTALFDERLPLYAWQEDIDFSARITGDRIKTDAFAGVHCGAKSGRETSGRRLGYSQIVNPWYLWRKGTMSARFGLRLALRNIAANHIRALYPEPWIDRAARATGNWLGIVDILRGQADPGRILNF